MKATWSLLPVLFVLTCAAQMAAQVDANTRKVANNGSTDSVGTPVHVLDFKLDALITGVKASPALAIPFECSTGGAVLVDMVNPLTGDDAGAHTYVLITGDKGIRLDTKTVPDLDITSISGYSFAGGDAVHSVSGRPRAAALTAEKPPSARYIVYFGPAGEFKKLVRLET